MKINVKGGLKLFFRKIKICYGFLPSGKYRKPAWTDRVLWQVSEERKNTVQMESYTSQQSYLASDHRPVGATLVVDLNVRDLSVLLRSLSLFKAVLLYFSSFYSFGT